jgi:hypothetical protein
MVPQAGKPIPLTGLNPVVALAVAPDGVRIAMIVQDVPGNQGGQLQLAAINPKGVQTGQSTPHGNQASTQYIGTPQVPPPGPGITDATALTWYNADNLIVLTTSGGSDELQEVPVDGRASTNLAPPQTLPDETITSIAAGNGSNVIVAGLSDGKLEVSAGFEGPWEPVPGSGHAPAYVIPPAPTGS